jgi:SMI1 / KNR4 family (SUKH-1)
MLNLSELIEIARAKPGVTVHPPEPLPSSETENLPVELVEFYGLCNGIDFYTEDIYRSGTDLYALQILSKQEVNFLDPAYAEWVCNGIDAQRLFLSFAEDPWGFCYCFDTTPARYGQIYDVSFSDPPIRIGDSLTGFLARLLDLDGEHPDWRTLENYDDDSLHPCSTDPLELQI